MLRELIADLAAEAGRTPAELTPSVVGVTRQLVQQSLLEPVSGG